jgi:hypothetical protein
MELLVGFEAYVSGENLSPRKAGANVSMLSLIPGLLISSSLLTLE